MFPLLFSPLVLQVLAKDLVRTRNYVTKFIEFRSHLQGVGLKLETVRSHEAMAGAMKDVTKAMVSLNKQVSTQGKYLRSGGSDEKACGRRTVVGYPLHGKRTPAGVLSSYEVLSVVCFQSTLSPPCCPRANAALRVRRMCFAI